METSFALIGEQRLRMVLSRRVLSVSLSQYAGKGYVLVAADMNAARSIVKMKADEDKTKVLSPHLLMSYSGEPGE